MEDNSSVSYHLEQHETKSVVNGHVNGPLTVIGRDWEEIIKNQQKMFNVS